MSKSIEIPTDLARKSITGMPGYELFDTTKLTPAELRSMASTMSLMSFRDAAAAVAQQQKQSMTLQVCDTCPSCRKNPPNIVEEAAAGDLVCADCGLVVADRVIDERAEWRVFENGDSSNSIDPSRVGSSSGSRNSGGLDLGPELHTTIATNTATSGGGRTRTAIERAQARTLYNPQSLSLRHAAADLDECCTQLRLDASHASCVRQLYKHALDRGWVSLRPSRRRTGIAACIAVVCRLMFNNSRSLDEVRTAMGAEKKLFGSCFGAVLDEYQLEERAKRRGRDATEEEDEQVAEQKALLGSSIGSGGSDTGLTIHGLEFRPMTPQPAAAQQLTEEEPSSSADDDADDKDDAPSTIIIATAGICERICERLDFRDPFSISKVARSLVPSATDVLGGKSPKTVAATCVLIACYEKKDKRSFREIAAAADCGLAVIKRAYQIIWQQRERIVMEGVEQDMSVEHLQERPQ